MTASRKTKPTRAETVLRQLAYEIVAGNHPPGVRLDEVEQSRRMSVSRTPLREALRHLSAVGLVESVPHCGVIVSPGGRDGLVSMLEEMEVVAVRWLAQRSLFVPASGEGMIWPILHQHCGNPVLSGVVDTLWRPLLVMCDPHTPWKGHRGLEDQERAMRQAIGDGLVDDAERFVRLHVKMFINLIMDVCQINFDQ